MEQRVTVEVVTADAGFWAPVTLGNISCREFPFVVITSNGERQFPPAFLRRCMRLDIQPPSRETLVSIVTAQLGAEAAEHSTAIIEAFLDRREHGDLATDQLLNAIYLATSGSRPVGETRDRLLSRLLRTLDLGSLRMIERLLEILSASAEAPDAAELADALWLATHIPESSAQVTSGAGDGACAGRPGARSRFRWHASRTPARSQPAGQRASDRAGAARGSGA